MPSPLDKRTINRIITWNSKGKNSAFIANKLNLDVRQVAAHVAHITMGTYKNRKPATRRSSR